MRITLDLDDEAMAEALEVAPGRTRTAVINDALREYVRRRRQRGLLEYEGKARWEGDALVGLIAVLPEEHDRLLLSGAQDLERPAGGALLQTLAPSTVSLGLPRPGLLGRVSNPARALEGLAARTPGSPDSG